MRSTSPAGGPWSAQQTLGASNSAGSLDLALDGSGNAIAAWPKDGPGSHVAVVTRPAGGAWSGFIPIEGDAGRALGTTVAAAPGGDMLVGWGFVPNAIDTGTLSARAFDVSSPLVRASSLPATGTVGQPVTYSLASADAWSSPVTTTWTFGDGSTPVRRQRRQDVPADRDVLRLGHRHRRCRQRDDR